MTTVTIGRHSDSNIVLSHPSVSRNHAELDMGKNGECKLVDMNSKYGTFVRRKGSLDWEKTSVVLLEPTDSIRFGSYELTAHELLSQVEQLDPGATKNTPQSRPIDPTPVERNPETGEIINRREH